MFNLGAESKIVAEIRKQGKQSQAMFSVMLKAFQVTPVSTASERGLHQNKFKDDMISEYQCGSDDSNYIRCMVTGYFIQRHKVIASHLIPLVSQASLKILGYNPAYKWNPKNGLLLYKSVDKAYENMEITFLLHSQSSIITIQVLYDDLLPRKVFDGLTDCSLFEGYNGKNKPQKKRFRKTIMDLTFGDLNGRRLILPSMVFPSRRILTWVAQSAYDSLNEDDRPHQCGIGSCPTPEQWDALRKHVSEYSPGCSAFKMIYGDVSSVDECAEEEDSEC
jgi:hypothetical protein